VTSKDLVLAIIGRIGTAAEPATPSSSPARRCARCPMEARMTMCNMSIEAGARAGMVAVDDKTIEYIKGRPLAPSGEMWDRACRYWRTLVTDEGAQVRHDHRRSTARRSRPQVSWGTSPEMVVSIEDRVPTRTRSATPPSAKASSAR
jgi:3-isopropylmalate/(R)-2-methylmalate dehydratase large subunit